ncbi:MAG: hypothetical protein J5554_13145 [Paludibacteraceae bacterium]|nr:hypothetical protein [Paludibacteraceae bacterium]
MGWNSISAFFVSFRNKLGAKARYGRFFFFAGVMALVGCQGVSSLTERPLAVVDGHKLYLSDVPGLTNEGLTAEDSAKIIDKYIKVWATEKLVVREAEKNVGASEEIENLMERYRQSLLVYEYQLQLVNEVTQDKLSEEEVKNYYEEHEEFFLSDEPLFRGFYVLVSTKSADMDAFRMLCRRPDDGSLDILESLCIKNAAKFEYFKESWLPFSEIQKKVPLTLNVASMMRHRSMYETKDSTLTFMIYIDEFLSEGEAQPFSYAEPRVRAMISEKRKSATIKKYEGDLYNEALKNGDLKIYRK